MKVLEIDGDRVNLKLSPSFMDKANCPLYLKLNYVDKLGDRMIRIPALRGQALHSAIESLLVWTEDEGEEVYDISDEQLMEALVGNSAREVMSETAMMMECLVLWRDKYRKSPYLYGFEEKLALDENLESTTWDNGSYRGILDIVDIKDTHCTVTDWKSQPNILSKTDLAAHEQFTHYCWLAWKTYDHIETFSARIFYLRYGFWAETERTIAELEAYERALLVREQKILQTKTWAPCPGSQCNYCDYIHLCPLTQIDPVGKKGTQEWAKSLAEAVTVREHWLKGAKSDLKEFVKENDNILTSEGWVYGLKKTLGVKYSPEKVKDVLERHGFEFASVSNVDVKKLKKLAKEATFEHDNPQLEADLNAIAEEKHSTTFKGWKPKD